MTISRFSSSPKGPLGNGTPTGRLSAHHRSQAVNIGLISDTHGLLRTEALDALHDSDFIIHAGDVGDPAILDRLAAIAPVTVVRGNVDHSPHADAWPDTAVLRVGAVQLFVLHDVATLQIDTATAGYAAVVYGHSHKPAIDRRNGVLFINPGSAGPRRFRLPIAVAVLTVHGREISAQLIELAL